MAERLGKLPLRLRYELLRLSQWTEVPVSDIYTKELDSSDPYASVWKRLTQTEALRGKELPSPSNSEAWDRAGDKFDQVVMSGQLVYKQRGAQDVFGLRLNPLRLDHSHRLGRRFGFDRFFRLLLPLTGDRDSMDWLRCDSDTARETVIDWIATTSHGILGRQWKALWIDDHATLSRGKAAVRKDEAKEILLFAENGLDFGRSGQRWPTKGELVKAHTPLRVEGMIDWFIRCDQNRDSSYLKLFARISQGLSKTVRTVVFTPSQIRWRKQDVISPTNSDEVMNDGCDIISAAAARQVARILNIDGHIPSAFQARIAGAKGVWIVDPRDTYDSLLPSDARSIFISITPSQVKFRSDPTDLERKADRDTEDRVTFEVLKYSSGVCSRTLNTELITILEAQGVPRATFESHLRRYLSAAIEEQKEVIRDRLLFRKWVYDKYSLIAKDDRAARSGSLPAARSDQMSLLLDAGFHPQECYFLNQLAQQAFKDQCERLRDRYRIPLGRSAYTFCVPDMTQTLEEGTVHLAFSRMFVDEASGFQGTALEDIDILVARHPANRPFDIQKVRAVANPALSRLKDVIVFPTRGRMPLAQKLSGGDYDGDEIWICWEPDIVSQFHNANEPTEPAIEELGITRETAKFCDLGPREDVNGAISEMLRRSFHFCAGREMLGTCTNYYRRLCYSTLSLQEKGPVWIASLLGHLVDRKKQGNRFTMEDWERLRARKDLVPKAPREPAYSTGDRNKQTRHVLDFLRFKVMEPVVEEASRQLHHLGEGVKDFDEDLVRYWKRAKEEARSNCQVKAVLDKLVADLKTMKENWGCKLGARIDAGQQPEFIRIVRQIYERFNKLLPPETDDQPLISRWRAHANDSQYSEWKLLRAAAAYSAGGSYHSTFCWYIAGTQLAYIKCISTDRMRTVDQEMYASYKPDAKFLRNRASVQTTAVSDEDWDSENDEYGSMTYSEFDSVMPR